MIDIKFLESEIRDQYLANDDNRPWIIGFSGGKDSTMLLQLVWSALSKIEMAKAYQRAIYVVCNNTLVENPKIINFTERTLNRIESAALKQSLPISVVRTTPKLEDTFWLNLIGKGYPTPSSIFRWCTDRLKISPTTKFILDKINDSGEVIILLGTRSDESSNRAKSMKQREIFGKRLRKHVLPNAYVYAPLKDVVTDEVWQYLLQNPPLWGGTNRELVTLYRNATGGDCPLVIDTTTPSCGNSRFGCWVCTVVQKDKSMQALIDNGEEWMLPLLELRNYLAETQTNHEKYRQKERRNGTITEGVHGPYFPSVRAKILEDLLKAQKEIREEDPNMVLISQQELIAIQIIWYRDGIFYPRVSDIYNKVYNINSLDMDKQDNQRQKEDALLHQVCHRNPDDVQLINNLLDLHKSKILLKNRNGLKGDLEKELDFFLKKKKIETVASQYS